MSISLGALELLQPNTVNESIPTKPTPYFKPVSKCWELNAHAPRLVRISR